MHQYFIKKTEELYGKNYTSLLFNLRKNNIESTQLKK